MSDTRKYLIFSSDGRLFGVDTDYVETILNETAITFIPMLPGHIRGVINLRGLIVPIIDFKMMLGQGMSENSCVVVLRDDETYVGILVDDVADMYQSHPRLVPKRRDRICNDIQGYEDTRIRENKHCV